MLAFSDESLTRIMIGATAVPHEQREQWLRKVASEATAQRRRKAAASRARAFRQRQRDGERSYRLSLSDDVIEALIVSGRLSEQLALDHRQCERALADVVHEWAQRWLLR